MPDYLWPDADVSNSGWSPSTGTNLWEVLDEATPNDGDYVSTTATGSIFEVGLSNAPAGTDRRPSLFLVRVRTWRSNSASSLRLSIRQGATEIRAQIFSGGHNVFAETVLAFSLKDFHAITDGADLRIRVESRDMVSGDECRVSWIEMEWPPEMGVVPPQRPPVRHPITHGLVGAYLSTRAPSLLLRDWSGRGNHGTWTGTSPNNTGIPTVPVPIARRSVLIAGSGANGYDLGVDRADFDFQADFSISFWVSQQTVSQTGPYLGNAKSATDRKWMITRTATDLVLHLTGLTPSSFSVAHGMTDGVPAFWCFTRQGNVVSIFRNCQLLSSTTVTGSVTTTAGHRAVIGNSVSDTGSGRGRFICVLLHKRAITDGERAAFYRDPYLLANLSAPAPRLFRQQVIRFVRPVENSEIGIYLSNPALSGGATGPQPDPNQSLGGYLSTTPWEGGVKHDLFDVVSGDENAASESEYRCVFVHNLHPERPLFNVVVYIGAEAAGGASVALGADPSGISVHNYSAGVQAQSVGNENTAPAGVSFSAPTTKETGVPLTEELPAGYCVAFWVRRTAANNAAMSDDLADLVVHAEQ